MGWCESIVFKTIKSYLLVTLGTILIPNRAVGDFSVAKYLRIGRFSGIISKIIVDKYG